MKGACSIPKKKLIQLFIIIPIAALALLYGSGYLSQLFSNYRAWQEAGAVFGTSPAFPDAGFFPCLAAAFHFPYGLYIVARTNALRAERDIAALTADDQLMRAAQVRADEMAATGNYSHTRPDGRKYYTVTDCRQVGENIHQIPLLYLAQQKTTLAETLVYSWSKSAGHMENMTDESYAAIGVGLARGTDANGLECWYCVQLFLRSGYSISAVDKPATK